jgi:hypothetical protein
MRSKPWSSDARASSRRAFSRLAIWQVPLSSSFAERLAGSAVRQMLMGFAALNPSYELGRSLSLRCSHTPARCRMLRTYRNCPIAIVREHCLMLGAYHNFRNRAVSLGIGMGAVLERNRWPLSRRGVA